MRDIANRLNLMTIDMPSSRDKVLFAPGPLTTNDHFPNDPSFTFDAFYRNLSDRGGMIYPDNISPVDLFRIGFIGRIFESDVRALLAAIQGTFEDLKI